MSVINGSRTNAGYRNYVPICGIDDMNIVPSSLPTAITRRSIGGVVEISPTYGHRMATGYTAVTETLHDIRIHDKLKYYVHHTKTSHDN